MTRQETTLRLSAEELALLSAHLHRHLSLIEKELVRTDNPALQHAIAHEVKALEQLVARIDVMGP